jgi:Flp pilus assembly protein TadG
MPAVDLTPLPPGVTREVRFLGEPVRVRTSNEGGAAVVEFALVVPILLLIVTGIFRFGVAFNHDLMLTDAVAIGGRYLSISRGVTTDPCATAVTTVANVAPNLNPTNLTFTFGFYGATGAALYGPTTTKTCSGATADLVASGTATLKVTYPCNLSVFGKNLIPGCLLTATNTEVIQ